MESETQVKCGDRLGGLHHFALVLPRSGPDAQPTLQRSGRNAPHVSRAEAPARTEAVQERCRVLAEEPRYAEEAEGGRAGGTNEGDDAGGVVGCAF